MKLRAMLREKAAHDADVATLQSREVTVEATSYEEAYAAMIEQTPAGWIHLWVDVDRS